MTANEAKPRKRRIETHVTEHTGTRLDRLAKAYRTTQVPGANIEATIALRAVIHVGLDVEEKRLGLPPLPEPPEPPTAPAQPTPAAQPKQPKPTSGVRKKPQRARAGASRK
jgi:hypothetical protein